MFDMKKLVLLLMFICIAPLATAAERLSVVTSVKPLQLVANAIVADLGDVEVLIPAGSSPHHYSLKPSGIRTLNNADLIVWVGPSLEQFLTKVLQRADAPVLQLLEVSDTGSHGHEAESTAHDEHHHHGGEDPHIWMDPLLMLDAAEKIKNALSAQYPQHAVQLEKNYQAFADELLRAEKQVRQQLIPHQKSGFVVFHDAFALLVEHYGLNQKAFFTVDPARAPGAKKLAAIQELLKTQKVGCVFVEPQFEAAVIKQIVSDLPVKMGQLDPLAIDVTLAQGYPGYLQILGSNIERCLQ